MIIKTFRAETSSAALKRIREEMGGDAIVLKTTQKSSALGRIIYEVTACLEHPTVGQTSKIFPDTPQQEPIAPNAATPQQTVTPTPQTNPIPEIETNDVWQQRYEKLELKINEFLNVESIEEHSNHTPFDTVVEQLKEHDFSIEFIDEFVLELTETYDGSDDAFIFAKIKLAEKLIQYTTTDFSPELGDKIAFVGPAGSGKSSVMGKLATNLVMSEKKKVTLITLDDVKMGAFDETAAYAEILGTDFADNRNADALSHNEDSITLIDTYALPQIVENIIPINEKLDALGTTSRIAVFSAIMRSKDVVAMKEQMMTINPTHLVITKNDMTTCLGTLITAAHSFGLKIIYTTDSNGGAGTLYVPHVEELVNAILQIEVVSE